jgi:hypothetical protein
MSGPLDLGLIRIKLALDESTRRVDDKLLFFGKAEIHERASLPMKRM